MIADLEELENLAASNYLSLKNQRERSIDITKERRIHIPVTGGTAKLSGRDYEFRDATPRREQIVRSEDLSRKIQGESGKSQPTETTDDAECPRRFLVDPR